MHLRSVVSTLLCAAPLLLSCGGGAGGDSPAPAPDCRLTSTCPAIHVAQGGAEMVAGSMATVPAAPLNGHRDVVLTISNPGLSELRLTGNPAVRVAGGDAGEFAIAAQPDVRAVGTTEVTSFTLRFEPTSVGTKIATLTIPTNVPDAEYAVTIQGAVRDSIWLFRSAQTHNGNLGGRVGADAICATDYAASYDALGCSTVHAFLGVSATDRIDSIGAPAGHDVRTAADVQIETSWSRLWDGDAIATSLSFGVDAWWTGSSWNGSIVQTCGGWTNGGATDGGTIGERNSVTTRWVSAGGFACNFAWSVLCVCW
jgi:hypothetical protein